MALSKTVTTVHGFVATDAYHRVEALSIEGTTVISFRVRSYKQASGLPAFGDEVVSCNYALNGDNPLVQAYTHLKTLPAWAGATDV